MHRTRIYHRSVLPFRLINCSCRTVLSAYIEKRRVFAVASMEALKTCLETCEFPQASREGLARAYPCRERAMFVGRIRAFQARRVSIAEDSRATERLA